MSNQIVYNTAGSVDRTQLEQDIYEIRFYQDLTRVKNVEELNEKVLRILSEMGFSDFTYYRMESKPSLEGQALTTLYDIMKSYAEGGFYEHDLIRNHLETKNTPTSMSVVEQFINNSPIETTTFSRYYELIRLCKCYGFNDFYTIPMDSCDGEGRVALAVTSKNVSQRDFNQLVIKNEKDLRLLIRTIDYVGSRKFSEFFVGAEKPPEIVVSPRPLQLLNVMAKDNLLLKQAADKLCIGIDTANKHMAAVKQAFDARTPTAALYRAIKVGLIDLES